MSLRVAIDAGSLLDAGAGGGLTGVGRYTRELANALESRGVVLTRYAVALKGSSQTDIARLRLPARLVHRSWRTFGRPSIGALIGEVDVVHGTNFVLPPTSGVPGVVTIHDLSFLRDDAFPGAAGWRDMAPWSAERAARVLVPTNAIAEEVTTRFGIDPGKVTVTYEGVAPVFFGATPLSDLALERLGIRRPFAVAVGTLEPRKNLPRLLDAWKRVGDAVAGWTLVLTGPRGWGPKLRETPGVVLTGWVGDETLPGLLAAADLFCYPSLYEGFGLPPLEAMAAGTACLAGRYSAAEEVLADAAVLVDPMDVSAMADALRTLATDEKVRRSYALAGRARATGYTWERTARVTIEAYEAVLSA